MECFSFAVTTKTQGHEVKLFLMGEAVECEGPVHNKYNVNEQWKKFESAGGEIPVAAHALNHVSQMIQQPARFLPWSTP